jgi:MFS family permease
MENSKSPGVSKRVVLIINIVSAFVGTIMFTSISVALPTIGKDLSMEAVPMGWVVNVSLLSSTAVLLACGRLADIYGLKKFYLYGTIIFAAASFLCAFANSGTLLIAYRAFQAMGSSLAGSVTAILVSVFPPQERGKALGMSLASTYLGACAGPFLGGVLTQHIGWRSIFLLVGFLSLVTIVLIIWKLKREWAEARGEKFDTIGAIIFGLSLVVAIYGFTMLLTPLGMALVVAGILGLVVFFRWESRRKSPLLNVNVFRKNRVFVFANLATLINYSANMAVIILLTLYLQYNKGLDPQTAGAIVLFHSVGMAIMSPIAGRLSDRIEPRKICAVSLAMNCVLFLFFYFLTDETPLGLIMVELFIFGISWGLFSSPNVNAVMGSVDNKYLAVASATQGTMRSAGMMLSMAITMILFSAFIGDVEITPQYYPAFLTSAKVGFLIFAALSFSGIFVQLAGKPKTEPGLIV